MQPLVEVDVVHGAAITSLFALDREWLVQGRSPDGTAAEYVATPPRGWDEMLPSIEPCETAIGNIPDHGDAWRHPWVADSDALTFTSAFGYSVSRTIHRRDFGLDLNYELRGGDAEVPVLWAAHPLFRAAPGTHVRIPMFDRGVLRKFPTAREIDWSEAHTSADALPTGTGVKYVFPSDAGIAAAEIVHADGAVLRMSWNTSEVPYFAVYLENLAHSIEPAIALEPMLGWYDALSRAVANDRVTRVGAGHVHRWSLHLDFRFER